MWLACVKGTMRIELRQWNLKSKQQGNWANLSFSKEAFTLCGEDVDKNFQSKGPVKSRIAQANANDLSKVGSRMMSRLEGSCMKRLLNETYTMQCIQCNQQVHHCTNTYRMSCAYINLSEWNFLFWEWCSSPICLHGVWTLLSGFKFQMVGLSTPCEVNCMSLDRQRPKAELATI